MRKRGKAVVKQMEGDIIVRWRRLWRTRRLSQTSFWRRAALWAVIMAGFGVLATLGLPFLVLAALSFVVLRMLGVYRL